jgi:hypothetical protein
MLDTGAPFVVLSPVLIPHLSLTSAIGPLTLSIRTSLVAGTLHRIALTFAAEHGDNLTVDAIVFVPDADPNQDWSRFPSFIGLNGCLERIRFAIDPLTDTFYFGSLA